MPPKLTWLEEISLKIKSEKLPTTATNHANLSPKPIAHGQPKLRQTEALSRLCQAHLPPAWSLSGSR